MLFYIPFTKVEKQVFSVFLEVPDLEMFKQKVVFYFHRVYRGFDILDNTKRSL